MLAALSVAANASPSAVAPSLLALFPVDLEFKAHNVVAVTSSIACTLK